MPIVRNAKGQSVYVSVKEFRSEIPEDFFKGNYQEFQKRLSDARIRVFEAIRFNTRPLSGRGKNHDAKVTRDGLDHRLDWLTDLVDEYDGRRARNLQKQHKHSPHGQHGLAPFGYRLRSPQDVKRRRSALFGGTDMSAEHFGGQRLTQDERDRFVNLMRWLLLREAITVMWSNHELELVGDTWYVPVSVMDKHVKSISNEHHKKPRIKNDNRSYHGRPQRDRNRNAIAA